VAAALGSLTVQETLVRWGPDYLARFGTTMPPRQRAVLEKLLQCRTPALGGALYACPGCGQTHYSYHSCNDRHCPQCGGQDAQQWLQDQQALLLPLPYFLVTFTVPEALRRWLRSHPKVGYDQLFAASAQALQDLAQNPTRLGATLGLLGVLHTWSRTLEHHPHVHYLVPGGGLSLDQCQWIPSSPRFLVRVEPLSDRFRNLFRQALEREHPEALQDIPTSVWKQRWVVHSLPVDNGQNALRYLSRYVFKTATGNRPLTCLPNGRLRWPYRDSATAQWRHLDLEPFEFLRRFLQHVLPQGFHRVRRFGWLHPGGRQKCNRVRALLHQPPLLTPAQRQAWFPTPADDALEPVDATETLPAATASPRRCPHCQNVLVLVGHCLPMRAGRIGRTSPRSEAVREHPPP
jgi:hypothetical protein